MDANMQKLIKIIAQIFKKNDRNNQVFQSYWEKVGNDKSFLNMLRNKICWIKKIPPTTSFQFQIQKTITNFLERVSVCSLSDSAFTKSN